MRISGERVATLACLVALCVGLAPPVDAGPRAKPAKVQNTIRGATQMFVAPWGLAAQGSGMLRILPRGKAKWQVVHQVKGDSLYRIAFDDGGRLLAWWEKEAFFHLFVPATKAHETFPLPAPPDATFTYGFRIEDMYFAPDGSGAILYMNGFKGGRTWEVVAYHLELKQGATPTFLFRQPGHVLHTSARATIRALPRNADDMCEHTACHPLGAIIAWEISGTKATRRVLLDGKARKEDLSRVQPVWGSDGQHLGVVVDEHPHKRHLLRWKWGDAKATFTPLPPGPPTAYDAEAVYVMRTGDIIEVWLTEQRGLEIRRHPAAAAGAAKGKMTVTSVTPPPKRTPHDRPLFHIAEVMERTNGDVYIVWGEYLLLVPPTGPARRLDLRAVFARRSEFSGRLLYVPDPEGVWVGIESGRNTDFTFLAQPDLEARLTE